MRASRDTAGMQAEVVSSSSLAAPASVSFGSKPVVFDVAARRRRALIGVRSLNTGGRALVTLR